MQSTQHLPHLRANILLPGFNDNPALPSPTNQTIKGFFACLLAQPYVLFFRHVIVSLLLTNADILIHVDLFFTGKQGLAWHQTAHCLNLWSFAMLRPARLIPSGVQDGVPSLIVRSAACDARATTGRPLPPRTMPLPTVQRCCPDVNLVLVVRHVYQIHPNPNFGMQEI